MADIQAFRGLRYDLGKVGALSEVVAPPYDVIDGDYQNELYELNPYNVVRLILNRGDDLLEGQSIYQRAAEHLKKWKKDGVLQTETEGTVYVYHQTFEFEGQVFTRRGFMSRVKLEPFGEGNIYPHEETHSKAKEDRFRLMTECRCNLSQIFSIFPDPDNSAQELLESAIVDRTPLEAVDRDGVKHELWMVRDPEAIAAASQVMGTQPLYIADGHHRYETACNIRDARRSEEEFDESHPANYVMMMCVSMSDPGMVVLPTHRLFRGIPEISSGDLTARLEPYFVCEVIEGGQDQAASLWETIQIQDEQGVMAFFCQADQKWLLASIAEEGIFRLAELEPDRSESWRSLGVSILHRLVIEELLGCKNLPSPKYVHSIDEVIDGLNDGDVAGRDATGQQGTGSRFELGCLVMPATVQHVQQISELGERMPAKSTYFYPKLLSGLVFNPLD